MKKNIILCAYGTGIGGMEVLFSGFVKYLLSHDINVILITIDRKDNIYRKLLKDEWDKIVIVYRNPDNILYMSDSSRNKQRQNIQDQLKEFDLNEAYAICGFYIDLLILIDLLKEYNTKITLIWPHPLDWINYLPLRNNQYYFKKHRKSRHFLFQKQLFSDLEKNNASYYTSYSIYDFNCWYYELPHKQKVIEGLPVQNNAGESFIYKPIENSNRLNILWVGRFDYYKNDAILYIYKCLEDIKKTNPSLNITFNIAGHGRKKFEKQLKESIHSEFITVKFLGTIKPSELNAVFSQNDIGIAMGVTVKQMGMAGLPAILIDSMSKDYKGGNCCNWLYDIFTGDDGDGMYYKMMNAPLNYRKNLKDLIEEIIQTPASLKNISDKCKEYVVDHYSYERQYGIMLDRVISSTFEPKGHYSYRYGFLRRIVRTIVKKCLMIYNG